MARRLHTSSPEETSQGEDLNELLPGSPSQAVAHHFSTEIKAVSNPDAAPQVALSMADKLVIIPPLALLHRSRRSIAPRPLTPASDWDSDEAERAFVPRP